MKGMGNLMETVVTPKRKRTELISKSCKAQPPSQAMEMGGGLWIGDLPPELLQLIFGWVPARDLVKIVPLVCRFWHAHANEPMIWMDLCKHKGLDAAIVPGGVTDWRRFYFTPIFQLLSKNPSAQVVSDNKIVWKGQGTVISSNELPTTGVIQWQVRVITNAGASWVCFGVMAPEHVSPWGDGDWMPSFSFCTCCDGYPKGTPRWDGHARGKAINGDVYTLTADLSAEKIRIVGPRGVDMTRKLPRGKYVLYFTVSTSHVELALENAFYSSSADSAKDLLKDAKSLEKPGPTKKRREDSLALSWRSVSSAQRDIPLLIPFDLDDADEEDMMMMGDKEKLWIGDLPPELLSMILSWVPPKELVRVVPLVCKYWNNSSGAEQLWMELCAKRGLDEAIVPGGVMDWRRFYFTPTFTFISKTNRSEVKDGNNITWSGQGTVCSAEEIPLTGKTQWHVRIIRNEKAIWVCFGLLEPHLVKPDGDWMPSYSFCTCCDGYPKGQPRWTGQATGDARPGDVFVLTVDRAAEQMTITGPRGINMTRALPNVKYVLYFTVSARRGPCELAVENVFHSA